MFSRVDALRTWCTMVGKVLLQRGGMLSNLSKVGRPPSSGKQKQSVEFVEELCARLMNRDEDCLACCRELLQEANDVISLLASQT